MNVTTTRTIRLLTVSTISALIVSFVFDVIQFFNPLPFTAIAFIFVFFCITATVYFLLFLLLVLLILVFQRDLAPVVLMVLDDLLLEVEDVLLEVH